MYDKEKLLNSILEDWAYKVPNGKPDTNDFEHRKILKDVMKEHGMSAVEIGMVIQNLTGEKQLLVETDPLRSITATAIDTRGKTHVSGSEDYETYIDPYQVQSVLPKQDSEEDEEELEDDKQDTTVETYIFDQDQMAIVETGNSIPLTEVKENDKFKCFMTGEVYCETTNGTLVKEQDYDYVRIEQLISEGKIDEILLIDEGKIKDFIIRSWTKIKNKIKGVFSKVLGKLNPGEEKVFKLPSMKNESLDKLTNMLLEAGAKVAIQGNYNEALTGQYVVDADKKTPTVFIIDKYKPAVTDIKQAVKHWNDMLVKNVSDYKKLYKIIEGGSKEMAKYIIGVTDAEKSVIQGIWLDNQAFQSGVEYKADIMVSAVKEDKEVLNGYSLKLYQSLSVNLSNSTPYSLVNNLVSAGAKKELQDKVKADKKVQELILKAKDYDKQLKQAKKDGDTSAEKKFRDLRGKAREPINPILAKHTYEILKKHEKDEAFAENLLKLIGFTDKDTKILMAVFTGKNQNPVIIDRHPDLDVSNISVTYGGGVGIKIVGQGGKIILVFDVKEGEAAKVAGRVDFKSVDPVDMTTFNDADDSWFKE